MFENLTKVNPPHSASPGKGGKRKQRGKIQLKKRVNITTPQGTAAIYVKKNVTLSLEQFNIIKSDLALLLAFTGEACKDNSLLYNNELLLQSKVNPPKGGPVFKVFPNKPVTSKGILVRMGKGKGKIVTFSRKIPLGTVCILLPFMPSDFKVAAFLKKHPFFGVK